MKTKVTWTSREWRELADWFRTNGIDPRDRGFVKALGSAQGARLPHDRHRTMVGLPKEVRARLIREFNSLHNNPLVAALPEPEPVEPPKPAIQSLSTEDLLVELARRIARLLEPTPSPALSVDRGFHPPPKHDPIPKTGARVKNPKIVVVGPKGAQQESLRKKFSPRIDLRFVTCEDNPNVLRNASFAEEIILWTKFMNHAQQDVAKTHNNTWYANGMDEIEARLEKWL